MSEFTPQGNINLRDIYKIKGVVDPTEDQDAVTKKYFEDNNTGIDWTISQAPSVIHADNYIDTNTTYTSSDFNHDDLSNITGTVSQYNHPTDAQMTVLGNTSNTNTGDQSSSDFSHNSLSGLNEGTDYEHITQTQKTALHSSGSDTSLGSMAANVDMNTHKLTSLSAPSSNGDSIRATTKITEAKLEACDDHVNDNSQAHSDYLLNNASDTTSGTITAAGFDAGSGTIQTTGTITTGDHGTAATDEMVNVCYGTGDPPTANTTTIGTIFLKYTS